MDGGMPVVKELVQNQSIAVALGDCVRLRFTTSRLEPLASQTSLMFQTNPPVFQPGPEPVQRIDPPGQPVDPHNSAAEIYFREKRNYDTDTESQREQWATSNPRHYLSILCSVSKGPLPGEVVIEGTLIKPQHNIEGLLYGPVIYQGTYDLQSVNPFQEAAEQRTVALDATAEAELGKYSVQITEDYMADPPPPVPPVESVSIVGTPVLQNLGPELPKSPPAPVTPIQSAPPLPPRLDLLFHQM